MNTIDHFGKELVLRPINKVRVRFRDGRWSVEYRARKWLINFWSVEGRYRDFADAKVKAEQLTAQGGFFTLKDTMLEMDVNTDVIEDPVADSFTQFTTSSATIQPKVGWFTRIFKRH